MTYVTTSPGAATIVPFLWNGLTLLMLDELDLSDELTLEDLEEELEDLELDELELKILHRV